ncbi:MAG: hypothetical protein AAFY15_13440, partial [Cyanobacteria bacterium J06648_11]
RLAYAAEGEPYLTRPLDMSRREWFTYGARIVAGGRTAKTLAESDCPGLRVRRIEIREHAIDGVDDTIFESS